MFVRHAIQLRAQLFDDPAIEAILRHGVGDPESVLDGTHARGPVADDAGAPDSQEGATAEFLVFKPALEHVQAGGDPMAGPDGKLRQYPGELLAKRREQELDGALAGLEQDVAHEPIADDDPYVALVDVTPLDVAHEPAGPRAGMVQSAV